METNPESEGIKDKDADESLQINEGGLKSDFYLKCIADALKASLDNSKEKDGLKARKRFLKAENKAFKKEVADLKAKIV